MLKQKVFILSYLILVGCSHQQKMDGDFPYPRTPQYFDQYISYLSQKAMNEGVSASTIRQHVNNINYISKAVELDNSQAERAQQNRNMPVRPNPHGVTNYLNRVLTLNKINMAANLYLENQVALTKASNEYGVPTEYLLALWGMESSFGRYQGNFDVLSALATLAFDGRRETLFRREYIAALKMLQTGYIDRASMKGSWAGAMGQSQFMPSSFLAYAVDADRDGRKDIWANAYDVFGSIANYLSSVGWDKKLPWGIEVELTQPMELSLSGVDRHQRRSLATWQSLGVKPKANTNSFFVQKRLAELQHADLWLVRPNRDVGRVFLVTNNYRTLLDWNNSNYFAISIGMFADQIAERIK